MAGYQSDTTWTSAWYEPGMSRGGPGSRGPWTRGPAAEEGFLSVIAGRQGRAGRRPKGCGDEVWLRKETKNKI